MKTERDVRGRKYPRQAPWTRRCWQRRV